MRKRPQQATLCPPSAVSTTHTHIHTHTYTHSHRFTNACGSEFQCAWVGGELKHQMLSCHDSRLWILPAAQCSWLLHYGICLISCACVMCCTQGGVGATPFSPSHPAPAFFSALLETAYCTHYHHTDTFTHQNCWRQFNHNSFETCYSNASWIHEERHFTPAQFQWSLEEAWLKNSASKWQGFGPLDITEHCHLRL